MFSSCPCHSLEASSIYTHRCVHCGAKLLLLRVFTTPSPVRPLVVRAASTSFVASRIHIATASVGQHSILTVRFSTSASEVLQHFSGCRCCIGWISFDLCNSLNYSPICVISVFLTRALSSSTSFHIMPICSLHVPAHASSSMACCFLCYLPHLFDEFFKAFLIMIPNGFPSQLVFGFPLLTPFRLELGNAISSWHSVSFLT